MVSKNTPKATINIRQPSHASLVKGRYVVTHFVFNTRNLSTSNYIIYIKNLIHGPLSIGEGLNMIHKFI